MASRRLIRFVVVGASAALLQFGLTLALIRLDVRPAVAACLAFLAALFCAYSGQRRWTFASSRRHAVLLPRYAGAQAVVMGVTALAAELMSTFTMASPFQISAVATLLAGLLSYVLSSVWVFRG